MHRTPRPALVTAALAVVLFGAGCTTTVPGSPAATGAGPSAAAPTAGATESDPVAWVDKVCGALLPFGQIANEQPSINSSDPAKMVSGLSDFLGKTSSTLDGAIDGMAAAGPSPVDGGDEAVAALTKGLTTFRSTVQEAKTKIDAIDTSNPRELATELPAAVQTLSKLADVPNPTAELESNPELDAAAKKAPNCQQIEAAN
jgi:hypothetical protein